MALICSALSQHGADHGQHGRAEDSSFGSLMSRATTVMHERMAAAPQTGDPDRDFLAMTIPHHEGDVEMARLLGRGADPRPGGFPAISGTRGN